jgi:hypothetical protein|tara:strand:- start:409 stop:738 length:330 start_codon:yes stop_codon:yes gene_type:complete
MLYDKLVKAWEEADVNLWDEIRHDEWEMLFHSDGRVVRKGDNPPEEVAERMAAINFEKSRCVYENEDILVVHQFVTFPSGDKEAVMNVSIKKDGLLWRTETGATPLDNI